LQICNKQKRRIEGEKRENGGRISESTNKKKEQTKLYKAIQIAIEERIEQTIQAWGSTPFDSFLSYK